MSGSSGDVRMMSSLPMNIPTANTDSDASFFSSVSSCIGEVSHLTPWKLVEYFNLAMDHWREGLMFVGAAAAISAAVASLFVGISLWWAVTFVTLAGILFFAAYQMGDILTSRELKQVAKDLSGEVSCLGIIRNDLVDQLTAQKTQHDKEVADREALNRAQGTQITELTAQVTTLGENLRVQTAQNAELSTLIDRGTDLHHSNEQITQVLSITSGELAATEKALSLAKEQLAKTVAQDAEIRGKLNQMFLDNLQEHRRITDTQHDLTRSQLQTQRQLNAQAAIVSAAATRMLGAPNGTSTSGPLTASPLPKRGSLSFVQG